MDTSLRELAYYLAAHPHLGDIAVICANMPVIGSEQAERFARILSRYGFEGGVDATDRRGLLHRFGDAVLVLMLVLAANPRAVRSSVLRCCNMRIFVSRAALERRYASLHAAAKGRRVSATATGLRAGLAAQAEPRAGH